MVLKGRVSGGRAHFTRLGVPPSQGAARAESSSLPRGRIERKGCSTETRTHESLFGDNPKTSLARAPDGYFKQHCFLFLTCCFFFQVFLLKRYPSVTFKQIHQVPFHCDQVPITLPTPFELFFIINRAVPQTLMKLFVACTTGCKEPSTIS